LSIYLSSHDVLRPAIPYPFCSSGPGSAGNTSSETIPSVSGSAATIAPTTAAITLASLVFIPTAQHAITTVQASRARVITLTQTPLPPLDDIRLLVKVAHVVFQQGSPIATFKLFTKSWQCTITRGELYIDFSLTLSILRDGRKVNLPH
jgi:hypothetical protein